MLIHSLGHHQTDVETIEFLSKNQGMHRRRKRDTQLALDVGKRIHILMLEKGLNRTQLAPEIGISPSTLWDYLNGASLPGLEVLLRISDYFSVPVDWILKGQASCIPFGDGTMAMAEKIEEYVGRHPNEIVKLKGLIDLYTEDTSD